MHCCTGNGARTIYYIWENILDYDKGNLRLNLLLNRASPWADVNSHLPYKGQVDVSVKKSCKLSIRIPEWADLEKTQCKMNEEDIKPEWDGRYAVIGEVSPGDSVIITLPVSERDEKVNSQDKDYVFTVKGNDIVHVEPQGIFHPLYQREKYRQGQTKWKSVERFVTDKALSW